MRRLFAIGTLSLCALAFGQVLAADPIDIRCFAATTIRSNSNMRRRSLRRKAVSTALDGQCIRNSGYDVDSN
jgi:hypothetical protein